MSSLWEALAQPLWQRVTLTLLHFLWQGVAVAVLLATLIDLIRVRRAATRYVFSLLALIVMLACPVVTFLLVDIHPADIKPSSVRLAENELAAGLQESDLVGASYAGSAAPLDVEQLDGGVSRETRVATLAGRNQQMLQLSLAAQPFLVAGWLIGVTVLAVRLAFGLGAARWIAGARQPVSIDWTGRAFRLGRRIGFRKVPSVFGSARVKEALVVGFWRPMVLLPLSWLAEMAPQTLEAIIAHELAHIRRNDLWVILFQRLVETLLFYHPAVWWLSRRIRFEREMCCDEMAVAVTGERVAYANALELVARRRLAGVRPEFAAMIGGERKMKLLSRVRNVLGAAPSEQGRWWPIGLLMLAIPLGIWSFAAADDGERDERRSERADSDRKDVERQERERDGDRPRDGELERDGDRPRDGDRERDGDRPRDPERRRDGERERDGDRPRDGDRERDGNRPRDGDRERDHEHAADAPQRDRALIDVIEQLRREVSELRREVQELKRDGGAEERLEWERRKTLQERQAAEQALRQAEEARRRAIEAREQAERRNREADPKRENDRPDSPN